MANHFYVYQLRVVDEELPFYVGKGKDDRAYQHLRPSDLQVDSNEHKVNKINKAKRLGKQILVEFIKTNLCEDDAFMWEVFWIAEYGRYDLGYGPLTNKTDGGEGMSGRVYTEELRQKRRDQLTENNPMSDPGIRAKHMQSLKVGEQHPYFGTPPWENPKTQKNAESMRAWCGAESIFQTWKETNKKHYSLATLLGYKTNLQKMVDKFSAGWIPTQDKAWLTFKEHNNNG